MKFPGFSKMIIRSRLQTIILLLTSSILLCFLGFYNNFPLIHWDSAVYIYPAFKFYVPNDRPAIYGFFVRLTSLNYSLWLTILSQGMIVSLSIYYYFKYVFVTRYKNILFLCTIVLLSIFTTVSFYVSYLLPDIFISVAVLNLGLLVFAKKMKFRDILVISAIFMFSLTVHNSHFMIAGLIITGISVMMIFRKFRNPLSLKPSRLLHLWIALILAFLFSSSLHYLFPRTGEWVFERNFTTGLGGHVFLVSKFNQAGILQDYLDEKCCVKHYKICEYKDSIPATLDFMWKDYSPLYKTGGWHANKDEYREIIFDILTTPKHLATYIFKSCESSAVQFFSFDVSNVPEISKVHFPDSVFTTFYPAYRNEYRVAKQNKAELKEITGQYNNMQRVTFFASIFFIILIFFMRFPLRLKWFSFFILISLMVNSIVCSSLSAVDPRYQGRLIWIILIPLIFAITESKVLRNLLSNWFSSLTSV